MPSLTSAASTFQGALPTNCTNDADCPAALVCYDSTVSWTNGQSYCLCSTWYGWVLSPTDPPNCDLSGSTIGSIVFFAICAAVILWRMFVFIYVLRRARKMGKFYENSSFVLALFYCAGWLVTGFLRCIFAALEFGHPQDQDITPFGPDWKYSPYGVYQTKPLFASSTVFGIMVDYQLILVWFAVILMSSKSLTNSKNIMFRMKLIVWAVELAFLIGAPILIVQDQVSKFLYFSVGFFVLALIGYAVAGKALYSLLSDALKKQTTRANTHMMAVARWIKWTAIVNGLLITFNIVVVLGLALTNPTFKEYGFIPAGFHNASIGVMTCQLCVVTEYFKLTLVRKSGVDKSPSPTPQMSGKRPQPVNNQVERPPKSEVKAERGFMVDFGDFAIEDGHVHSNSNEVKTSPDKADHDDVPLFHQANPAEGPHITTIASFPLLSGPAVIDNKTTPPLQQGEVAVPKPVVAQKPLKKATPKHPQGEVIDQTSANQRPAKKKREPGAQVVLGQESTRPAVPDVLLVEDASRQFPVMQDVEFDSPPLSSGSSSVFSNHKWIGE